MKKTLVTILVFFSFNIDANLKENLEKDLDSLMTKVIEWRHDIHENPELGNREFRTAKKVADHLTSLGMDVETGIAHTGVVGLLTGDLPGPTIAIRADMDALPVVEKTGLPYASKIKTTYMGNEVGVMHACGHDAHVAILMGAAEFLAKNKKNLKGNIMLIFQPAEEGAPEGEGGGAELMLAEGIFDRYNPEVIFGLHVTNSRHGHLGVLPGPAMAAASSYRITVNGVQAHGSRPWDSIDPIMATAQLIESLNTVVSRRINIINNPAVISVGMVQAGTRNNIIPDKSQITGTIRTFDPDLRAEIYDEIRQIARGVAEGTGTKVDVEFDVGGFYPVTFNNVELTNKYAQTLSEAADGKFFILDKPTTGAEDFSFFSQQIPGMYFWLGVNEPGVDVAPGNHTPFFKIDDRALDEGVKAMVYLALDYASNN